MSIRGGQVVDCCTPLPCFGDDVIGPGGAAAAAGQPVESLLGTQLFGIEGALRLALARGERREGWHVVLTGRDGEPRPFAVTVAS